MDHAGITGSAYREPQPQGSTAEERRKAEHHMNRADLREIWIQAGILLAVALIIMTAVHFWPAGWTL